jgi:hypothetical protein
VFRGDVRARGVGDPGVPVERAGSAVMDRPPGSVQSGTPAAVAEALRRLVLEYDRLYARIAGDPGVRLVIRAMSCGRSGVSC